MSEYSYLIGKKITWKEHCDEYRGTYLPREGTVKDVKGKNVLIEENMDWRWIPLMRDIRVIDK